MPRGFALLLVVLIVTSGSVAIYLLYPSRTNDYVRVKEGGAAILDALSELDPNPAFEEAVSEYLTQAGMFVDVYKSSAISVEFMKSFPAGYELVVFRIHGGTSKHGVFYFTSEPYDESKHQPEQIRDEVRPAKDYEGHPQVFAFGARFVDTYLRDHFRNAIIIGMECFGSGTSYGTDGEAVIDTVPAEKEPNLADAFHSQGASAIIGWDKLVSLHFSDQAIQHLIRALAVDHLSVRQGVDLTNRELGPDPAYKSRVLFHPESGGDSVFHTNATSHGAREIMSLLLLPVEMRPNAWITSNSGSSLSNSR
jgi:hypothetical protein